MAIFGFGKKKSFSDEQIEQARELLIATDKKRKKIKQILDEKEPGIGNNRKEELFSLTKGVINKLNEMLSLSNISPEDLKKIESIISGVVSDIQNSNVDESFKNMLIFEINIGKNAVDKYAESDKQSKLFKEEHGGGHDRS